MQKILVINPNSNESVTDGLRKSLTGFHDKAHIDYCTLAEGPFGIESDEDIETVKPLIAEKIEASPQHDAYVIACYSDPGLAECRKRFGGIVFGMQRSAVETAAALGGRFGVLALSDESIARHLTYIDSLGYSDRLAGELPLDVTVDEAANDPGTADKAILVGRRLIDEFGVSSLILGCAGMAHVRDTAERELSVPVIEPVQAAVEASINPT